MMILNLLYGCALLVATLAHPQTVRLPQLPNVSPPDEVNALQGTAKVQRSINDHVTGVDNTEDTIREVERIIKADPNLPRLTRGEILDLLDNITKQDHLKHHLPKSESERDPKALMVVKAYTPYGSGEVNVEELYTKLPITAIVDNEESGTTTPRTTTTTGRNVPQFRRRPTKPFEEKKQTTTIKKKPTRGNYQFRSTTPLTTTSSAVTNTEDSFSTTRRDVKRRRRPLVTSSTTTEMSVTTFRPRRRRPSSYPTRSEIRYPNHQYPEQLAGSTTRIVRPAAAAQSPAQINAELEDLLPQEMEHQEIFTPMRYDNLSEPSIEIAIPDHLKHVMADLNLAPIKDYNAAVTSNNQKQEIRKAEHVFGSLGAGPVLTTTPRSVGGLGEDLSPDMKELLRSFGLIQDVNQKNNEIPEFNPEKAEINPESYVGFKPLPENTASRREMEDLLVQFGLLDKTGRNGRSLKKRNKEEVQVDQISLDMVPEDLKSILQEMGFESMRAPRRIRQQPKFEETEDKSYDFSPGASRFVSEEEIRKLGKLLKIMKKLEQLNGTITEENMNPEDKKELKELLNSLNQTRLSDEHLLEKEIAADANSDNNAVKRQDSTTTTERVVTVTAVSVPDGSATASIKDLEDSFGGVSETATEALPEPTTPKKNGFYYLLDWNTFFEIDDQKGKRVNLRFQPKVGDPKRFYSVTVP